MLVDMNELLTRLLLFVGGQIQIQGEEFLRMGKIGTIEVVDTEVHFTFEWMAKSKNLGKDQVEDRWQLDCDPSIHSLHIPVERYKISDFSDRLFFVRLGNPEKAYMLTNSPDDYLDRNEVI